MKITKDILREKTAYLNYITDRSNEKYGIDYAYGGARLVLISEHGGVTEVSPRGTKTEIGVILDSIINFYELELRAQ